MTKASAFFSLFCGVAMLATWGFLLGTGQVPELQTSPFETSFLLAAEFTTAISLLLGGYGLLTGKIWGLTAELVALGMLIYCTIFSTGAFSQTGNLPAAVFFAIIATLAAIFSAGFVSKSAKS